MKAACKLSSMWLTFGKLSQCFYFIAPFINFFIHVLFLEFCCTVPIEAPRCLLLSTEIFIGKQWNALQLASVLIKYC